jgi:hypothetical protein
MAKLGNKHECLNCGTKFYDLGRSKLVCPSCEGDQAELAKEQAEGGKPATKKGAKPATKKSAKPATKKGAKPATKKKASSSGTTRSS